MIGTDIVDISRIENLAKKSSFVEKVFTSGEIEYYKSKGEKAQTLAGLFAGKEAVAKCFGTGFNGFRPTDIEIYHNEYGCPKVRLHNGLKMQYRDKNISVSISHDGNMAIAMAMIK